MVSSAQPGTVGIPLRIPQQVPLVGKLEDGSVDPDALQFYMTQQHLFIQQLVQALNQNAGVGARPTTQQPLLAGMPVTLNSGNLNRLYVPASVNLLLGEAINLYSATGILTARPANATDNTQPCSGFVTAPVGILAGAVGEVQIDNGVAVLAGLTVGARYYLDVVDGGITLVAPVAAGNIEQLVGIAIDATHLAFNTQHWVQH